MHSKDTQWRSSQRERLHFLAHNDSDATHLLLLDTTKLGGGLEVTSWSVKELNEKWMDVGLSGGPVQVCGANLLANHRY